MTEPRKRGRPPKIKEDHMQAPPLTIDEPGFLEQIDAMVESGLLSETTDDAQAELAQMYADHEPSVIRETTKPTRDKFVDVGNGLYLPVRQRIVWMRGEPEPHPDWLIQTELIRFEEGEYKGPHMVYLGGRMQEVPLVERGFAVVAARVLVRNADGSEGPVIGEGTAMERSELFHDFIEKAETAAIGRALAVAGYGTEAALDLDEGANNIADAPVRPKWNPLEGLPPGGVGEAPAEIKIEASAVPGVRQGGRQSKATRPQLDAIRNRVRELVMAPSKLQEIIRATIVPDATGVPDPFYTEDVEDGPDGANEVLGYLSGLSFEDCGKVVLVLQGMSL